MDSAAAGRLADRPGCAIPGYVLKTRIGTGGMGNVWHAVQCASGREVAIKILAPTTACDDGRAFQRFAREIAALKTLDHPGIARAIDSGETGTHAWLAMELLRGRDLQHVLGERNRLREVDVLRIAIQVADGLRHAYRTAGLIHRDVKPANIILLDGEGPPQVKLIDFGLARTVDQDEHLTISGCVVGSPHYMAPERILGEDLHCSSDLYALGATLYELLTGQPPFDADVPVAILRRHLDDPVPDPGDHRSDLHPRTCALIRRVLAKRPEQRHAHYDDFIADARATLAVVAPAAPGQGILHAARPSHPSIEPVPMPLSPAVAMALWPDGTAAWTDPVDALCRVYRTKVQHLRRSGMLRRPAVGRSARPRSTEAVPAIELLKAAILALTLMLAAGVIAFALGL